MLFWIFIFLVFLISFFINCFVNDKERKILLFFLFAFITVVGVFRNNIGLDYFEYQRLFYSVQCSDVKSIEPSFIVLTYLLKYFGLSTQAIFAVYTILINMFIFLGAKFYCKDNYYALNNFLIFWCLYFIGWWNSLTQIRQVLAVAVFFYFSRYLIGNNFKKYLIGVICATCVHYSSICLILLYPLRKIQINLKYFFSILMILIFLSSNGIIRDLIIDTINILPFSVYKITAYINNDTKVLQSFIGEGGTGLGTLFYYIVFITAIIVYKDEKYKNDLILFISLGLIIKTVFFMFPPLARLSLYFELFGFILLANFQKKFFETIFIVGLSFVMFIVSIHHIKNIPLAPKRDFSHNTNKNIDYKFTVDFFEKKGIEQ